MCPPTCSSRNAHIVHLNPNHNYLQFHAHGHVRWTRAGSFDSGCLRGRPFATDLKLWFHAIFARRAGRAHHNPHTNYLMTTIIINVLRGGGSTSLESTSPAGAISIMHVAYRWARMPTGNTAPTGKQRCSRNVEFSNHTHMHTHCWWLFWV